MTRPLTVTVNDRAWHLFGCEYDTPDGKFAFDIYALSHEHAAMMLDELKSTARLLGKIEDLVPGEYK
jgi:hypothetical protein